MMEKSAGTGRIIHKPGENDTEQKESVKWTQKRARRLFHSVQEAEGGSSWVRVKKRMVMIALGGLLFATAKD